MRDPKTGRVCKKGQQGNWYYLFYISGQRYYRRIYEATTKQQAWIVASNAQAAAFNGTYGKKTGQADFVQFIQEEYLNWSREHKRSWKQDEHYAKIICDYFRGKTFADITAKTIERYKDHRREGITRRGTKRNPNTVNREMGQLSKIFSLAKKRGHCEANPCRDVDRYKVRAGRKRVLTEDEEARILAAMVGKYAKLKPAYVIALNTGLRLGELFKLEWRDIDFEKDLIRLRPETTKSGIEGVAYINDATRLALLEQRAESSVNKEDRVFGFSKNYAGRLFSELCVSLGLEDVSFHPLRHTFATRLGEDDAPAPVHQELMRHQSYDQTLHYTHLPSEKMVDHVKRLEKRSVYLRQISEQRSKDAE
ncbi:MAG TPA: tyrosine-type recombinase/integrase [Blastocatellia bacterium]|nr:tyrosine-type recombinase/integrase [Blastocatellia bacterium]HMZ19828.1 tyrosine-type recombinase/integrase [Blastocatellia bacterium]